jgi:hypothetical protein
MVRDRRVIRIRSDLAPSLAALRSRLVTKVCGMSADASAECPFSFMALTAKRWGDLETLFGPERGASSGCWCLWWRVSRKEWTALSRKERKERFRSVVETGPPPGILAYRGSCVAGWCAVSPRSATPRFDASRLAAPLENLAGPVWAITCFYIGSDFRRCGLMRALAEAACAHAFGQGAMAVEACPIEPRRRLAWGEGHVGLASAFRAAGFEEVARRGPTRPLMRRLCDGAFRGRD